jgi:hypothetical protein
VFELAKSGSTHEVPAWLASFCQTFRQPEEAFFPNIAQSQLAKGCRLKRPSAGSCK